MAEERMLKSTTMELVNPFNRPIPGQSLTNPVDDPYPWESPPKFTKVNEALDFVVEGILGDEDKLLAVLEIIGDNELTISDIAQILLEYTSIPNQQMYGHKNIQQLERVVSVKTFRVRGTVI